MGDIEFRQQNLTLTGEMPRDRPYEERPHRLYFALTNHCNRACPWCSTCSTPKGQTWLTLDDYRAAIPPQGPFEVQLEGGEPTLHPDFGELVAIARADARCQRVIVVTNGVVLPRDGDGLRRWIEALGTPLTIKLSINHFLLHHDAGLIELAAAIDKAFKALGGDRELVLNVRLRKGINDDDQFVVDQVSHAGLLPLANVFFLQKYGFGERFDDWEEPFIVGDNFSLVNPDGSVFGADLVARSRAMGRLD